MYRRFPSTFVAAALFLSAAGVARSGAGNSEPILPQLPGSTLIVASTVPANGDVNPYGVAFVPPGFAPGGVIHAGDILVSNFNDSANLQGTGTTVVSIAPDGTQTLFFQGPTGLGLTTALGVLRRGVVLVGNLPTTDGTSATVQQGSLIALDRWGNQIASLTDATFLDGPWDLTVREDGNRTQVFVSSVLNGTVSRLDLDVSNDGESINVERSTVIAWGYTFRTDPAALVIGPTGLAYDHSRDLLYVASTGDNTIFGVADAGRRNDAVNQGQVVYQDDSHLRGPLGLLLAPNGNLLATNGDAVNGDPTQPSEIVEFTPAGIFVAQYSVDLGGQGGAFGIAIATDRGTIRFAAVDDVANTLEVWTLPR